MKSRSFKDLEIWKLGLDLAQVVYRMTGTFPTNEQFGLTSQIRRAAVSISSNIAEGWGRGTRANLANFVVIARGSANELESLCEVAYSLGLMAQEDRDLIVERLETFGKRSYAFLNSVKGYSVKESSANYGSLNDDWFSEN